MKVVIFGATGLVGKNVLKEALYQNHQVTVLTRKANKVSILDKNLTVVVGDVTDRKTVSDVLKDQDAVIQCLGIGGKGDGKLTTFVSDANKLILDEMKKNNVQRLIAMSVIGAGDSIAFYPKIFTKVIFPYFMKWFQVIIDDKNRMEPTIMNSGLDWTIVRSTTIVDKPSKGNINVTLDGKGLKYSISIVDVATFIIKQLTDKSYLYQAPSISNN
jgi:Putative NADH-flavin reductase